MAEEAREVRDQHREALDTIRNEQELLRTVAETARTAAEEARVSAEAARDATMAAVHATADTLQATLESMKVVEDMRRTLRDIREREQARRELAASIRPRRLLDRIVLPDYRGWQPVETSASSIVRLSFDGVSADPHDVARRLEPERGRITLHCGLGDGPRSVEIEHSHLDLRPASKASIASSLMSSGNPERTSSQVRSLAPGSEVSTMSARRRSLPCHRRQ